MSRSNDYTVSRFTGRVLGLPTAVALGSILIAAVLPLRALGRSWWCACGEFRLYATEVLSSHNSQHFLDAYSFTHVSHGLIFFALFAYLMPGRSLDLRLLCAAIVEGAWEILENSPIIIERYRAATMSLNYYGDSIVNSVGDLACCIAGFLLAARIPWKVSVGMFILIELGLLSVIRDNLTLNIIMLLYPIPAVKTWQAG